MAIDRKGGAGRREDLRATVRRLADDATAMVGYPVGTASVFRMLAGRRPARGGLAVRAAIEEAGFHAPVVENEP